METFTLTPELETAANQKAGGGYPGSKRGAGVLQTIINNIPPCDTFIEAFAGTALVTQSLRPARCSIVIDADAAVCDALKRQFIAPGDSVTEQSAWDFGAAEATANTRGVRIVRGDAVRWLETNRASFNRRTVIYCDPPYLIAKNGERRRRYYRHEMRDAEQHTELLAVLSRLTTAGVPVLLSGYRSPLYDAALEHWRRVDYTTGTRGGPVTESLWCNFDAPEELQDFRYLGENFRERERIKRKQKRWRARLAAMTPLERAGVLWAVRSYLDGNGDRNGGGEF